MNSESPNEESGGRPSRLTGSRSDALKAAGAFVLGGGVAAGAYYLGDAENPSTAHLHASRIARDRYMVFDGEGNPLVAITATSEGDGKFGGAVNFYGANAESRVKMAWNMGIDVAAEVPYRDLFIARVNADQSVQDFFYASYTGGRHEGDGRGTEPYLGIGYIPGDPRYTLSVGPGGYIGGIGIRNVEAPGLGNPLAILSSANGNPALWIDSEYWWNADPQHTQAGAFAVKANGPVTSAPSVFIVADPDGTNQYAITYDENANIHFRAVSAGRDLWSAGVAGGSGFFNVTAEQLGFFGSPPQARRSDTPPPATDLASAIELVNALRADLLAYGLIA